LPLTWRTERRAGRRAGRKERRFVGNYRWFWTAPRYVARGKKVRPMFPAAAVRGD
jgi:hypothetical protein